ncbi:MAG: hypothetical protein GX160_07450 [Clostridiales bacterium]|nr:hypothetical protein [Clostridiales bacterium]
MVIDMKNLSINIKTEFILQLKKCSTWVFFLIEFILLSYSIELTRNELLFLIAENRIKISYEFPPFINSGMLFVLLFGSTIALLWGILNIHYDYKYKSHIIRSCLFDWANVLTSKAIIAFYFSLFISLVTTLSSIVSQNIWNHSTPAHAMPIQNSQINYIILKFLCLLLMLWISTLIGMVIGSLVHKTGVSIVIAMIFDQFILSKTILFSGFVYIIFSDAELRTVSTPEPFDTGLPIGLIYLLVLLFIVLLIFLLRVTAIFKREI